LENAWERKSEIGGKGRRGTEGKHEEGEDTHREEHGAGPCKKLTWGGQTGGVSALPKSYINMGWIIRIPRKGEKGVSFGKNVERKGLKHL